MEHPTLARPGGLRIARPAVAAPAPAQPAPTATLSPGQRLAAANAQLRQACVSGDSALASRTALEALSAAVAGTAQHSLLQEIAALQPGPTRAIDDTRLWLLRRFDGSLVGLYRLCANGSVSHYPHPNEARWRQADGLPQLHDEAGRVTTDFRLGGVVDGRAVYLGAFMDGVGVHVLSEVRCAYSQWRMLAPELVGSCGLLLDPAVLSPVDLPPVPAVIIAAPRTGSHLLLNLLNSSGRVFFDSELLDEKQVSLFGAPLKHEDAGLLYTLRANDPVHFAKVMMSRSHHLDGRQLGDVAVRGFKLFAKHSRVAWDWVMDEPRMRIVHLHRANLLAEFSSLQVAYAEGHWVGGPQALRTHRIRFDAERFKRFVETKGRYLQAVRERLAARMGPSVEIEYGEFSRQNINRVLSFLLDEPFASPHIDALGLKRQLNDTVIARFENTQQVMACLRELGHEEWAQCETPEVRAM